MIKEYLEDISKLIGAPVSELTLERDMGYPNKPVVITDKNLPNYTKPDAGFSSRLLAFNLRYRGLTVTSFGLYEFPSCCAFCVSTQAHVEGRYRKAGVNTRSNQLRQDIARYHGYSAIICTDVNHNVAERKTLAKNQWTDIYQILNKRTGNIVNISVKKL